MADSDIKEMPETDDAALAENIAYSTGKVDRAKITQMAQLDAAEAVAMAGIAMESDEIADSVMREAVIAERQGDRKQAKAARKKVREARKKANADHKAATHSAKNPTTPSSSVRPTRWVSCARCR